MTQIWALSYRQSGSDRLEKQPTDFRQYTFYFGDRTLVRKNHAKAEATSSLRASDTKGIEKRPWRRTSHDFCR
jgi:hypothetical protein